MTRTGPTCQSGLDYSIVIPGATKVSLQAMTAFA